MEPDLEGEAWHLLQIHPYGHPGFHIPRDEGFIDSLSSQSDSDSEDELPDLDDPPNMFMTRDDDGLGSMWNIGGDIEADVSASILIRNGASAASYREFIGIDWLFNIFARLLM